LRIGVVAEQSWRGDGQHFIFGQREIVGRCKETVARFDDSHVVVLPVAIQIVIVADIKLATADRERMAARPGERAAGAAGAGIMNEAEDLAGRGLEAV
jgi:hypothetical protein